ncbi:1-(5-phosphoribosyl)-5-[(5-phosphoribosylamino)methylideneamino]imidazole-4-carboxamide isomerase [Lutibacter sp.]
MRIIPAIDIIDGKCVRLAKGDYDTKKVYYENPLDAAKQFEDSGIEFLHLVDLDGAKANHIVNYKTIAQIASKTNLKIDFGGGLKSDTDLHIAFESGATQITGGSIAVKNPLTFISWVEKYGADKIILGADVFDENIATNGWLKTSSKKLIPFVQDYVNQGVKYVICTDISKDGMLQGPSFLLYDKVLKATPNIHLIASGGITTIADLKALKKMGCEGAIIGKALYENSISLKSLEQFILNN